MTIYILGNGGHAKVLAEMMKNTLEVAFIDKGEEVPERKSVNDSQLIVVGVGDMDLRRKLWDEYSSNYCMINVRSHLYGEVGEEHTGLQFMPGVVIQPGCTLGVNVLVNTSASIDHDCTIGAHCHVAPGATLCGGVTLGEGTFVGAGATIVEGATLEPGTFVPAGTLVVGQDDMRKPITALRGNGKIAAFCREAFTATEVNNPSGFGTDTNP